MAEFIQRGLREPIRDKISSWLMVFIMDFENDSVVFAADKPDPKSIDNLLKFGESGGGIRCCFCDKISNEDIVIFLLFNKTNKINVGCNVCSFCANEACDIVQSKIKNAVRINAKEFARKYDASFQISLGGGR
jgi:hypothetical protein